MRTAALPKNGLDRIVAFTSITGLPAILSDCELRLLCAERLTDVRPSADWTTSPTDAEHLAYVAFCDRSLDEQRAHQHAVKLSESRKQIERILEGKRQKMRATGASEEAVAALSADEVLAQIGEQSVFNADNALRQVPTTGFVLKICVQNLTFCYQPISHVTDIASINRIRPHPAPATASRPKTCPTVCSATCGSAAST